MSGTPQPQSQRRVMWWARSFSRPLQSQFAADDQDTPDDLRDLLKMADDRQAQGKLPPKD